MNKWLSISLIVNFLLVILVCVAGMRIEVENKLLDENDLLISRIECEKEILQYDVDRFQEVYDSNQQELLDMENAFVDYILLFSLGCCLLTGSITPKGKRQQPRLNNKEEPGELPMSERTIEKAHAMIAVRIGDEKWLVEPKTDEHWKARDIRLMEVN